MNKLKKELRTAFDPPQSKKKTEFLRQLNYPKARLREFIWYQIGYIRKRIWILSILLLVGTLIYIRNNEGYNNSAIWALCSIVPFVAFTIITEIARSTSFQMVELEMTTKYNLRDVLLARMGVLGLGNLIVFLLLIAVLVKHLDYSFLRVGLYLFTPYLLTCFGSLIILNKMAIRDNIYGCAAVSVFVSVLNLMISTTKHFLYDEGYLTFWLCVFVLLSILVMRQGIKYLSNMEELHGT